MDAALQFRGRPGAYSLEDAAERLQDASLEIFLEQEYAIFDGYKNIKESRETLLFLLIKGNSLPGKQNKMSV